MPCHLPRYATISVPFCEAHAQEAIAICAQKSRSNLAKSQRFGTRIVGLTKNQIGRLVAFVRRLQPSK
jgi:hypothetical protein